MEICMQTYLIQFWIHFLLKAIINIIKDYKFEINKIYFQLI